MLRWFNSIHGRTPTGKQPGLHQQPQDPRVYVGSHLIKADTGPWLGGSHHHEPSRKHGHGSRDPDEKPRPQGAEIVAFPGSIAMAPVSGRPTHQLSHQETRRRRPSTGDVPTHIRITQLYLTEEAQMRLALVGLRISQRISRVVEGQDTTDTRRGAELVAYSHRREPIERPIEAPQQPVYRLPPQQLQPERRPHPPTNDQIRGRGSPYPDRDHSSRLQHTGRDHTLQSSPSRSRKTEKRNLVRSFYHQQEPNHKAHPHQHSAPHHRPSFRPHASHSQATGGHHHHTTTREHLALTATYQPKQPTEHATTHKIVPHCAHLAASHAASHRSRRHHPSGRSHHVKPHEESNHVHWSTTTATTHSSQPSSPISHPSPHRHYHHSADTAGIAGDVFGQLQLGHRPESSHSVDSHQLEQYYHHHPDDATSPTGASTPRKRFGVFTKLRAKWKARAAGASSPSADATAAPTGPRVIFVDCPPPASPSSSASSLSLRLTH